MKKKKTILLVANDTAISKLELSLKKTGYIVIREFSGERAIELLDRNNKIDLVLMDPELEGAYSGIDTGINILKQGKIPLLFLTDTVNPMILEKALNAVQCGFAARSSDISVLDAEIKMAIKCFENNKKVVDETELLLSEERYKTLSSEFEAILDHLPLLVFYKDLNNRFVRVNRFVAEAHKKEKSELEGVSMYDLYPEDVAERYYRDDLEVINSGTAKINIEESWNTDTGLKWVRTGKIPLFNDNGEVKGIIGLSEDITERKLAEQHILKQIDEINRLNDFYFTIIDSVTDWIVVLNADFETVFYNNLFDKTFNKSEYGISTEPFADNLKLWQLDKLLKNVFAKGISKETEVCSAGGDDCQKFYSINISPVFSDDMNVDYAVIRGKDITSSMRQMDEIIRVRDLLDSIIRNVPVGIAITDTDGIISYINRTFEYMSEFTLDEVEGRHISLIIRQLSEFRCGFGPETYMQLNKTQDYELLKPEGDTVPVKLRLTTIEKPVDKHSEVMFFITDVSFERKLELKQVRLQNHLESIIREMDDLNELLLETDVYNRSIESGAMEFEAVDRRIIRYVEEGLTNREIAVKLGMAEITIKKRLSNIYSRLGIKNKYQLIEYLHRVFIPDK